tara:strand:- start:128 stop:280 length:153 start_codon:yes stop_codon:yes gene_type:complete
MKINLYFSKKILYYTIIRKGNKMFTPDTIAITIMLIALFITVKVVFGPYL